MPSRIYLDKTNKICDYVYINLSHEPLILEKIKKEFASKYDKIIKIPIKVERESAQSKSRFTCHVPKFGIHHFVANDLDDLRERIKKQVRGVFRVDWKPKLELKFSAVQKGLGFQMNLDVTKLYVGTFRDKKVYERNIHDHIKEFEPREGLGKMKFSDNKETKLLINDTPENRAGLERLQTAFESLGDRFHEFFSPEQIEKNLTGFADGLKLLQGASNE